MMADLWRNVLKYSNKSQDDVGCICVSRPVISYKTALWCFCQHD